MKSMFAIGFAFTALLSMFNTIFDGRVVAKLPFTMSIRQNIQKALGFAPSRAASKQAGSMWNPDPNKYKWNWNLNMYQVLQKPQIQVERNSKIVVECEHKGRPRLPGSSTQETGWRACQVFVDSEFVILNSESLCPRRQYNKL